jgi:2-C-methyl-D-erythritol 4-phosphate cytidylyltransferase
MLTKVIAIVPAAGLGRRFGASERKTFVNVNGIPLLIHTLQRLQTEEVVTDIIPVLRHEDIKKGVELTKKYKLTKVKQIVEGGKERQDSIYNALRILEQFITDISPEDLILIHDGARPIIPEGTIKRLLNELKNVEGVVPGIPPRDTLKEIDSNGIVTSTVNREILRAIQTPQVFPFRVIKKAYEAAFKDGFYATDDAALVERIRGKIKIIEGSPLNIKVTTPEDLDMVEYILSKEHSSS